MNQLNRVLIFTITMFAINNRLFAQIRTRTCYICVYACPGVCVLGNCVFLLHILILFILFFFYSPIFFFFITFPLQSHYIHIRILSHTRTCVRVERSITPMSSSIYGLRGRQSLQVECKYIPAKFV